MNIFEVRQPQNDHLIFFFILGRSYPASFCGKLLPSFCHASTIPRISQNEAGKTQSLPVTPALS